MASAIYSRSYVACSRFIIPRNTSCSQLRRYATANTKEQKPARRPPKIPGSRLIEISSSPEAPFVSQSAKKNAFRNRDSIVQKTKKPELVKGIPDRRAADNEVSNKSQTTHPSNTASKQSPRDLNKLTEEEQLEQVEQILAMSRYMPTADPWGQPVDTLDVILPHPIFSGIRPRFPTYRAIISHFWENRMNDGKNATSLLLLAKANAIPGIDLSRATFFQKFFTQWPWRLLSTQSTRAGSWLEPFRDTALARYKELNAAIAQHDEKQVKRLTASNYQDNTLHILRKNQNPSHTYIWRFHREVTPTKVLSIRSTEGYLGIEEPKFGNRMMVHALLKFDTEQSLEIYDKRGKALHKLADGETSLGQGTLPAQRKRVTEYLVLEKRMWYDGPWIFREQLYDST
ncbi:hypothetical protein AMATHDRAFT_60777 [Amanita thiersii Skay4041]|uniref:Tim44-like domain-containing protein n=1 Tax=Amanita thiersii Skay4041 TaxID=703135 RepID=A0A2A9NI17_9AGAR|nr:hypothetical protein AMATHDRAFT_60777 [Amanita thiersii Skay4041]